MLFIVFCCFLKIVIFILGFFCRAQVCVLRVAGVLVLVPEVRGEQFEIISGRLERLIFD